MYIYETHLHTLPISACAKVGVRETLEFYKDAGYAGVFMTEHFIDGNFDRAARELPYEEKIRHYFSAFEEGAAVGAEIGLDVFCGIEVAQDSTHFLVYGIDKEWCLAHPDMDKMRKSALLRLMMDEGALVIHAHPFREAAHIDHIGLFPRQVHGVEVYNSNRTDFENLMAEQYADNYELIRFAGTDNHQGGKQSKFGGMMTDEPIASVEDFIQKVKGGLATPFKRVGSEVVKL